MSISWIWRAILRWTSKGKPEPEPLVVMSIMSLRQAAPTPLCPEKQKILCCCCHRDGQRPSQLQPNLEWVCRPNPYYAPCRPCGGWSSVVAADASRWTGSWRIRCRRRWECQWAAPAPTCQNRTKSNRRPPDLFQKVKTNKPNQIKKKKLMTTENRPEWDRNFEK